MPDKTLASLQVVRITELDKDRAKAYLHRRGAEDLLDALGLSEELDSCC